MAAAGQAAISVIGLFPIWAVLVALLAILKPEWLVPLKPTIVLLLGLVMFGMGITLTWKNYLAVLQRLSAVFTGVVLQFLLMPPAGWLFAILFGLSPQLLVGRSPGGTASNLICFLANGDVALSITLTVTSTLLAAIATPLLTLLYAGQVVPVRVLDMLMSVLQIIILPVVLRILLNHFLRRQLAVLQSLFRLLSVFRSSSSSQLSWHSIVTSWCGWMPASLQLCCCITVSSCRVVTGWGVMNGNAGRWQ